jgi:methyl-accepting chemotaxis protein
MEDVAEIAERLYGLLPEEFTAARDAEAKRVRASGDRESASAIAGLRRPSLAAWLVNALVRHRHDEVEQLLALGEAMRAAQQGLAGDQVRALGRQRQQVLAALGRQARALARELGHPVSEDVGLEVEQTLGAAMADPAIAEAVRSGRLTSPTSYAGLGLDGEGAAAPPRRLSVVKEAAEEPAAPTRGPKARRGSATSSDADERARRREEEARRREAERRAAELEQARAEAEEAEQAYQEAADAARAAQERHDEAEQAVEEGRARVDELEEELRRAEHEFTEATRQERNLRRERDSAARLADLAQRARDRARERAERLGKPD